MTPTVSVCVQTYNHKNYIKECLDSILMQQTDFPFEVILGEDESSDGTREICIDYADKYPDIIKLFLRNRKDVIYINGSATGRYNFIENLKACSGKYIALCEGDDYWTDPLKLQKQVDFLESNKEYAGCFHNTLILKEIDGSNSLKPWRSYTKQIFTLKDNISTTALFHTTSFLFRREVLIIPDWFVKIHSGDMALFSIIASEGPLYRIDDFMSVYRKNKDGITNSISLKKYHRSRIILWRYLKTYCDASVHFKISEVIDYHKTALRRYNLKLVKTKIKNILKL